MTNTKEKIPACPAAGKCGGCAYQGIPYEEQLQKKKEQVRRLLRDICPVRAAVGMEDPYHYRNKVHAAFGRLRDGRIVADALIAGGHAQDSVRLVVNRIARQSFGPKAPVYDLDECIDTVGVRLIGAIPESTALQLAGAQGTAVPEGCAARTAGAAIAGRLLGERIPLTFTGW